MVTKLQRSGHLEGTSNFTISLFDGPLKREGAPSILAFSTTVNHQTFRIGRVMWGTEWKLQRSRRRQRAEKGRYKRGGRLYL